MITITPVAAEQIRKSQESADCIGLPLRVAAGGCCSNSEYLLGFDNKGEKDREFTSNGIAVVVDPGSMQKVAGLTIDFGDDGEGDVFLFIKEGPGAGCGDGGGGCGCGGHSH